MIACGATGVAQTTTEAQLPAAFFSHKTARLSRFLNCENKKTKTEQRLTD
jgi:hypothetical protein